MHIFSFNRYCSVVFPSGCTEFFLILAKLGIFYIFHLGHSVGCVVFSCGFNWFQMTKGVKHLFRYVLVILICSFVKTLLCLLETFFKICTSLSVNNYLVVVLSLIWNDTSIWHCLKIFYSFLFWTLLCCWPVCSLASKYHTLRRYDIYFIWECRYLLWFFLFKCFLALFQVFSSRRILGLLLKFATTCLWIHPYVVKV